MATTVELVAFTGVASTSFSTLGSHSALHHKHATLSTVDTCPQRMWRQNHGDPA